MAHIVTSKIEATAVLHEIAVSPVTTEWSQSLSYILQTVLFGGTGAGMVVLELTVQEYEQWITYRDKVTL